MWVARDKDSVTGKGTLNLFGGEPNRLCVGIKRTNEFWSCYGENSDEMSLDEDKYPQFENLKWEDNPIEVSLYDKNDVMRLIADVVGYCERFGINNTTVSNCYEFLFSKSNDK